jgi:hypothetical protein
MSRDQQTDQTPDPQTEADTSEYDAAWDEITKDAAPSDEDRAADDGDTDQPADDASQGMDGHGADDGDNSAEASTDETSSQDNAQPEPQDATRDPNDPWASLPQDLRARVQRMEEENRRHRGNQATLQRELQRIREQYPDTGGKPASGKRADQAGTRKGDQSADDLTQNEDWKKLREEYPELLGPLEQQFQRMQSQLQELAQDHTHVSSYVQDQQLQRNYDTVAERHDDFAKFTTAPEDDPWARSYGEALQTWTAQQPEEVQAIVQRNAEDIYDPAKVDWVLRMFKASDLYRQMVGQTQTQPSAKPQGQAGKDDISERRKRRLDSAPNVSGKGPGAATGEPDDYDAAFEHRLKQLSRRERA